MYEGDLKINRLKSCYDDVIPSVGDFYYYFGPTTESLIKK